jgi:hypothetical protein
MLRSTTGNSQGVALTNSNPRLWPPTPGLPARRFSSMVEERREPVSDDFDIPQDPLPKLNLVFKLADIIRCRGRYDAAPNRILKATKRRTNKIHVAPMQQNSTATTPIHPSSKTRSLSSPPDLIKF